MMIYTPTGDWGQIDDRPVRKPEIGSLIVNMTMPASALAAAKGIAVALNLWPKQSKKGHGM